MSATNRGAQRHPDDFYRTPREAIDLILPHLDLSGLVLEPSCGDGAILDALPEATNAIGIEMDNTRAEAARAKGHTIIVGDFFATGGEADLVIGNPPFKLAMEFVKDAVTRAKRVCFLLRLNWLASKKRSKWLKAHRPSVYVLSERPSFAASVTCKVKCGWNVILPLDEERPKSCPSCGCDKVTTSTSDATDYAWMVWGEPSPTVNFLGAE